MDMTPDTCRQTEAPTGAEIDWAAELARHDRWLRTVVSTRLGEPQAVDEVMQNISLAAVRQQRQLRDVKKLTSWLYRLAVRQALLYRRKQGRGRKLVNRYASRFPLQEADHRQPEPLKWLLSEERQALVVKALERLPPRDAEILRLKYEEGWNYHKLAEHLGISHSAVEARLHRARQRLRAELAALDVTPSLI